MKSVEAVRSAGRAAALLAHPLRARILRQAQAPISASDLARRLGQPRQRVNYHVRELAREGFLEAAARRRKRNMVEQQYVASARAYVLAPEVLGEAALDAGAIEDAASAAHLVGLCAGAQSDIASVVEAASSAGLRVRTLSLQSDVRFESAAQRAAFTSALLEAVSDVVARHTAPFTKDVGEAAPGRPFRLIVGCYPLPGKEAQHGRTTGA